jgi:hypothetical protein
LFSFFFFLEGKAQLSKFPRLSSSASPETRESICEGLPDQQTRQSSKKEEKRKKKEKRKEKGGNSGPRALY